MGEYGKSDYFLEKKGIGMVYALSLLGNKFLVLHAASCRWGSSPAALQSFQFYDTKKLVKAIHITCYFNTFNLDLSGVALSSPLYFDNFHTLPHISSGFNLI